MNCKLTLQEKLKDLRTEQGLSLIELSEKTGISKSALGSYESDDTKNAITMNAIVTLAEFYGVTSDYLLGITENRECHPFPVDELGLDDDTIDLLKERNLNVRLICEMIKDPHFPDFLSDLEIYVDNLASAQIRNMNKYIEHNRAMIKDKYALSDSDHYMRSLKAALINEDNYFDNLLGNDISAIAKDLRELHKKDSNTGSNDTVFDDNALLVLTADEAGTAQLYVNDVLADTKTVGAGDEMKFEPELKKGRNDVTVIFTDAEGNATRKTFNFVANPDVDIVVDAAYTGEDGAESDGLPVYKTVQAAVNAVPEDNAEAKVIYIKNGEYNERVEVKSPYVSLLGQDSEKTHLFYSVCVANGNADSMWNRNAMYVDTAATGFTAENLTVENSYDYTNGSDQQADALCIVADQTACINVRLIGYQDTLLTDTRTKDENGNYAVTRQYFNKCYITGNVDFIYGAGTSVFEDCDIVARYTEYKSDGCYTAGRTYASTPYGYVFNNCRFLAEEGVADGAYRMARPWGADDSTTFMNCYLGRAISLETSYGDMSGNLAENARFAEYGSYGPGYTVNNKRPYLTSTQAAKFKTDTVMGDYDYSARIATLYGTQQEEPKTDVTVVDKAEVVKNVAVDENAVIKNAAGETVNPGQVSVVIEKAGDSVIDSIMKGFTAGGILIADGSTVDYYDIELQDENGQAVMLESGKIQITFAYKEGIDYSKVNVIVYHLNEKTGVIEKLETQLTSEGIRFEADSFSPFAVYYENKTVQNDDITKPDDTKTDDVKKVDAGSGTQQGENTGAADAPEESENAQQSADTGVQTGDTANGFGFLAAAVAAAGAGAYEFLKKRKLIRR